MRFILIVLIFLLPACSDKYIPMVKTKSFDPEWNFSEVNKETWLPAKVPGTVQTDLYSNGKIDAPLFEDNELKLQWISEKEWVYKAEFEVGDSLLNYKAVDFVFDGLDTYAGVFINDSLIISADNMFLQWRANGRKFLHRGKNTIKVILYSPSAKATEKLNSLSYVIPASDPVEPKISPFIRKAPFQFGWDWSPRFLTMGIWKDVKIVAHQNVYISGMHIRTIEIADTCAWLSADVTINSDVDLQNVTVTVLDAFKQMKIRKGVTIAEVKFRIFEPELWWPNGYGKQTLYDLTAKLFVNSYLVDSITDRIGIRTVELFQDDDEFGRSFYFRVNGIPIFMKGANYVPQSNFLSGVTENDYKRIVNDASAVGMNMLRVWGGGIYENEIFYDLCDEKGILIWQDFMFAGSMIPGDSLFQMNVRKEAEYQVKRLRNHPCIALWCGNNEIDVAWNNWGWQKQFDISTTDSTIISESYKTVFEKILPETIINFDQNRDYIPSSPISNWGKKENFNSGNMHYWGVWHGEEAIDSFKTNIPRFMTEYGMQSWPSSSSLKKNTSETRITVNGNFIKNRQRSYKGNGLLNKYIADYFRQPGNVEELCYLSQLNQAEAMRIAIESHRKAARFCMGSLYWQLNDVWDGASWSTIEKNGNWKAAHYQLKRLYAQNILIVETKNDTTIFYFQTENTSGQTGDLNINILDFKGRVIANYTRAISAGYMVAEQVFEINLKSLPVSFKKEEFFISAQINYGGKKIAEAVHYFERPSRLKLLKPDIKYKIEQLDSGSVIEIFTDVLVKGIMLEVKNSEGKFADNYFDLLPGEVRRINYSGKVDQSFGITFLNPKGLQ